MRMRKRPSIRKVSESYPRWKIPTEDAQEVGNVTGVGRHVRVRPLVPHACRFNNKKHAEGEKERERHVGAPIIQQFSLITQGCVIFAGIWELQDLATSPPQSFQLVLYPAS